MPAYTWLYEETLKTDLIRKKLSAMAKLGVPYSEDQIFNAERDLKQQAEAIANKLIEQGVPADPKLKDKKVIALIAYLQRLGTDIKKSE